MCPFQCVEASSFCLEQISSHPHVLSHCSWDCPSGSSISPERDWVSSEGVRVKEKVQSSNKTRSQSKHRALLDLTEEVITAFEPWSAEGPRLGSSLAFLWYRLQRARTFQIYHSRRRVHIHTPWYWSQTCRDHHTEHQLGMRVMPCLRHISTKPFLDCWVTLITFIDNKPLWSSHSKIECVYSIICALLTRRLFQKVQAVFVAFSDTFLWPDSKLVSYVFFHPIMFRMNTVKNKQKTW